MTNDSIVLESELRAKILPISRSTLWRWEESGDFPRRRKIGPRLTGWLRSEIEEWVQSRPSDYAKVRPCQPASAQSASTG